MDGQTGANLNASAFEHGPCYVGMSLHLSLYLQCVNYKSKEGHIFQASNLHLSAKVAIVMSREITRKIKIP